MNSKLLTSTQVREKLGNVSDMTLWRWLHHPTMNFPQPIYIGRRRYWREDELVAWLSDQLEAV